MGCLWIWHGFGQPVLMLKDVFLLCWRISMVYLALELVGSWVEFDFSVGIEALGELLSINVAWNQEFSDVLKFLI